MRDYLTIDLAGKTVERETWTGEQLARAGRYYIAKTMVERDLAKIDPFSPENPLIFSVGPFAGSNMSNANRISIGCKSPLTGGIKEANAGGTFGFALGQAELCGLTLENASDDWTVIYITKEGDVSFHDASPYMGKGVIESAALLHDEFGEKVSLAICGPVGEYQGLMAGISMSDPEGRPVRIAARGGVGAVMGAKKVKALVCDKNKMPTYHDRRGVMKAVKEYGAKLKEDAAVQNLGAKGTALVADVMNSMGGLPVRNFSGGQLVDSTKERMRMGGDFIREQNMERGGTPTHACMPGCMIKCSNIYADKDGNEMVSPLEYETIGLLGTNCGLEDPDHVAKLNMTANDLGVDTIELGATLALLMEKGVAEFGDVPFMEAALEDIRVGNERGKMLSDGAARVGEKLGMTRVPVIKKQAISAYDPRVIEVTGISMMSTAQGADHTTGNLPTHDCDGKSTEELVGESMTVQMLCAAADSVGLCLFGRSVTNINHDLVVGAINDAIGTELPNTFLKELGVETLALEEKFNDDAGFNAEDDELPEFFYKENLAPSDKTARHHANEVRAHRADWMANAAVEFGLTQSGADRLY
jgi:aldehyde:ferredoxin oxidoreductase